VGQSPFYDSRSAASSPFTGQEGSLTCSQEPV